MMTKAWTRWISAVGLSAVVIGLPACAPPEPPPGPPVETAEPAVPEKQVPQIIRDMIEAHGGVDPWRTAPTVSFQDQFLSQERPAGPPSRVTVEQGPRRAYLDFPGTEMRLAWDGEKAWSENWEAPATPRFLVLLNYYFLNLPWLTMDPGVNLGEPETGRLSDDPTEYVTVVMTFDAGVGDTPDDYYRLYIHPETHQLKACAYTVTYSALLPEGVESSPERVLVYDEWVDVGGLIVPTKYSIYEDQKLYAGCEIGDWSFERPFDTARMVMPEGAVIDTSTP